MAQPDLKSNCAERERLLLEYKKGAAEYSKAVKVLRDALGSVVMEELGVIRKNVERSRQECETARLRFEQHIQQHGC